MSAFQAYAGTYDYQGVSFGWRCYATARVHDVRRLEHAPYPDAPAGKKWVLGDNLRHDPAVGWLIDDEITDFSQILLQVQEKPNAPPERAAAGSGGLMALS